MAKTRQKVLLLRHTYDPDEIVALGARLCYAQADVDTLLERIAKKDQASFIAGVMARGHLSVIEHASFTFAIEGVSRTLLAQITRHRIASFSVQSQRYVSMGAGFDYVVPPSIEALGEEAQAEFARQMETMHAWYADWQRRLGDAGERSNEDARFVLPGACATRMLLTMNARELLHFFELRCCERAQWEIRALAWEMLRLCKGAAPEIFGAAGPSCVRGACAEGKASCGRMEEMRSRASALGEAPDDAKRQDER